MKRSWAWAFAWLACGGAAPARADKEFAYKFVPGEEYRAANKFVRTAKRHVKDKKAEEKKVEVVRTAVIHTVTEVASVSPKGVAALHLRVVKVEFHEHGHGLPRKYVSDDAKYQESADGWELYADAKIAFEIDAKGKPLSAKPDADTAAHWAAQPRELQALAETDALYRLLPFLLPLPEKAVSTSVGWREPRTFDDGKPLGKRDMVFLYSYSGNRRDGGRLLDEISVRGGEVKIPDTGKYDLLETLVEGRAEFESAAGKLRYYQVTEDYLFNPKGAKLPKHIELVGAGPGGPGDAGSMDEGGAPKSGSPGMSKGSPPGAPDHGKKHGKGTGMSPPKGGKGKGKAEREAKEKEKKAKEAEEAESEDKSIELIVTRSMKLSYAGPPLKDIE